MPSKSKMNEQKKADESKSQKINYFIAIKTCPFSTALAASIVGSITTVIATILLASLTPADENKIIYVVEPTQEQASR